MVGTFTTWKKFRPLFEKHEVRDHPRATGPSAVEILPIGRGAARDVEQPNPKTEYGARSTDDRSSFWESRNGLQ